MSMFLSEVTQNQEAGDMKHGGGGAADAVLSLGGQSLPYSSQ